jgi:hypothetical protein
VAPQGFNHAGEPPRTGRGVYRGNSRINRLVCSGLCCIRIRQWSSSGRGLLLCPEVTKDGGIGQATFDLDGDTGKATRFMTVVGINRAMHG